MEPLCQISDLEVSARDLILLGGGLFLLVKGTREINHTMLGSDESADGARQISFAAVIRQIMVPDIVFSLDSVITAVGMARHLEVMVAADTLSILSSDGIRR